MDDDCFVVKDGWADLYIEASKKSGIEHFVFVGPPYSDEGRIVDLDGVKVMESPRGGGVMLFFTRNALGKIGGYNPDYKKYGYEHAAISYRCYRAGLTKGLNHYASLPKSSEYIYSMDFHKPAQDPERLLKLEQFRSSVHGEDLSEYLAYNNQVYHHEISGPLFYRI
jgi:hypothetical protein